MQAKFAREYALSHDLNATKAAERVGVGVKGRAQIASKWLKMRKVRAEIERIQTELVEQATVSKAWWLRRQADIAAIDPLSFYDKAGFLKPLDQIPEAARRCIKKIKTSEIFSGEGGQKTVIGFTREIEFLDAQKALSDIGRHFGWLRDKVELEAGETLERLIAESMKVGAA